MKRFFSHITSVFFSLAFLWQSSLVIAAFEPPRASFPEGGPTPQSAGALLDVLTAGEDASSFTNTAKIGGAVQVNGLKVSGTNVHRMILTASTTAGVARWSPLPSSLPSRASTNQTLRYNGSVWVPSSFLSNTASRIGIGIEEPATTLEINDSGRAQVSTLRVTDSDDNQNPGLQLQYGADSTSDHWVMYIKKKDGGTWTENSFRVRSGGDDRLAVGPKGAVVFGKPSAMRFGTDPTGLEVEGSVRVAGQGSELSAFVIDVQKRSIAANIDSDTRYVMNVGGTLEASKGFCLGTTCYPLWDALNKWKKSSEGIYYDAGSIGVGADPNIMLDIANLAEDPQKDTSILRVATGIVKLKTGLRFDRLGREQWFAGMNEREDLFRIQYIGKQIDDFVIDSSGQVGIGTVPTSRMAVQGQPEFIVGSGGIFYDQNQKTVIHGTSTLFKMELKNGYFILVGNEKRIIVTIDSDTRMTINREFPVQVISTSTDFAVTYSFSPQGTGKIYRDTASESQLVIKGKDTVFQQELKVGFSLFANSETRFITTVDSDTSLRIDRPFSKEFPETENNAVLFSWRTPVAQFFSSTDAALTIDNDGRVGVGTFFPQADLSLQSSPNMQMRGLSIETLSFGAQNAKRFQSAYVRMRSTSTGEYYDTPFTIRGDGRVGVGELPSTIHFAIGPRAAENGTTGEISRLSITPYSGVQDPWVFKTSDNLENSTLQLWRAGKPVITIQSNGNVAFGDVKTNKRASVKGNTTVDGTTFVNELKLLGDITAKNFIIQQNGKRASVVPTAAVGSAVEPCETTCANNGKKCIYGTDDSNKEVDSYMRCDETRNISNISCLCAELPPIVIQPKIVDFCALNKPTFDSNSYSTSYYSPSNNDVPHSLCTRNNPTVEYPYPVNFFWNTLYGDKEVRLETEPGSGWFDLPRRTTSLRNGFADITYGQDGYFPLPWSSYHDANRAYSRYQTYTLIAKNVLDGWRNSWFNVPHSYLYPEVNWAGGNTTRGDWSGDSLKKIIWRIAVKDFDGDPEWWHKVKGGLGFCGKDDRDCLTDTWKYKGDLGNGWGDYEWYTETYEDLKTRTGAEWDLTFFNNNIWIDDGRGSRNWHGLKTTYKARYREANMPGEVYKRNFGNGDWDTCNDNNDIPYQCGDTTEKSNTSGHFGVCTDIFWESHRHIHDDNNRHHGDPERDDGGWHGDDYDHKHWYTREMKCWPEFIGNIQTRREAY